MDERKMNWRARVTADAVLLAAALGLLAWAILRARQTRSILLGAVAVAFTVVYLLRDVSKWRKERQEGAP